MVVASLPFLPAPILAALAVGVLVALPFMSAGLRTAVVRGVWRVRWLLLAVAVLFLFFSPGPEVRWLETLARVGVLVCAVVAVQAALYGVAARDLAEGLARVLAPLGALGVPTHRFAHRLFLTLDAVPEMQALLAASRDERNWFDRAAKVFARIEEDDGQDRDRA